MKKDLGVIFGLFLLLLVLLVFGGGFTSTVFLKNQNEATAQAKQDGLIDLSIRDFKIKSGVANTADNRKKGLGKRDSLALDQGLLFIFEKQGLYTFWMKDMKFAIDIIWIDENKKIVNIVQNTPPEPDKKDAELVRYTSPAAAKYVLEINAGLANLHGLQIGDSVNFEI